MSQTTIQDVCDYIIVRANAAGSSLNLLKLQKLLYYCQAWHLAFYHERLFDGKFQAWVHGPVNREIYDRFASQKSLYSQVRAEDARNESAVQTIDADARMHVESVLEVYMQYTGTQLEEMTHREDPWLVARNGLRDSERCEREIDEDLMLSYYAARVK